MHLTPDKNSWWSTFKPLKFIIDARILNSYFPDMEFPLHNISQ